MDRTPLATVRVYYQCTVVIHASELRRELARRLMRPSDWFGPRVAPDNRVPSSRTPDAPTKDSAGAHGAPQGFPRFARRCAALTRALPSRLWAFIGASGRVTSEP
jgi:hypothetical protein